MWWLLPSLHFMSRVGLGTRLLCQNAMAVAFFSGKNIRGRHGGPIPPPPSPNVYMVRELNKADGKPLLQAIKLVPLSECGSPKASTLCGRGHTCTLPLFIIHVAPPPTPPPPPPPFQNSCIRLLFWDGIDFVEAGCHGRTCPSP